MKYSLVSSFEKRAKASVLIVPFWEGMKDVAHLGSWKDSFQRVLESGDFKAKSGDTLFLYPEGFKEERVLLLGLGTEDKASSETLRRAYAQAVRAIGHVKAKSCHVIFPASAHLSRAEVLTGCWEGILLSNYAFNQLKGTSQKEAPPLLENVGFIGLDEKDQSILDRLQTIAEGIYFVRDLVNGNADEVNPSMLAQSARDLEKISSKIKTTIHDKKWLEKEKMGLILAVNRASKEEPYLIEISYKGNPSSKEHIVLVGKGVTYDTGGLALKTVEGMIAMKCDMAGAAAVLGTIRTAALLNLEVNISVLVPTVENCIDSLSYKHGDVYRSYSGKTVEINNTDAEGRLILADALAYAVKNLSPSYVIDLATLTGNVVLALGEQMAGFCANDETLAKKLRDAGVKSSDFLWQLPLCNDYKEAFKSDIADMVNSGGRDAGAIKGALFLQEFIGSAKWAHIDIAGAAFWTKPKYYHTTKATGYGVRLLIEFLTKISHS